MRQTSIFDAPAPLPLDAYDRLEVGQNLALTDQEVAALLHHGYALRDLGGGLYDARGQVDGFDGEMWADDLRCDLDLFYLARKALEPRRHPLEGL